MPSSGHRLSVAWRGCACHPSNGEKSKEHHCAVSVRKSTVRVCSGTEFTAVRRRPMTEPGQLPEFDACSAADAEVSAQSETLIPQPPGGDRIHTTEPLCAQSVCRLSCVSAEAAFLLGSANPSDGGTSDAQSIQFTSNAARSGEPSHHTGPTAQDLHAGASSMLAGPFDEILTASSVAPATGSSDSGSGHDALDSQHEQTLTRSVKRRKFPSAVKHGRKALRRATNYRLLVETPSDVVKRFVVH